MNYQTGVASANAFRGVGVNHVVKLAKNAGLDGIEWAGDVHVPCGNLKTAKKGAKHNKREAGLSIISYGEATSVSAYSALKILNTICKQPRRSARQSCGYGAAISQV